MNAIIYDNKHSNPCIRMNASPTRQQPKPSVCNNKLCAQDKSDYTLYKVCPSKATNPFGSLELVAIHVLAPRSLKEIPNLVAALGNFLFEYFTVRYHLAGSATHERLRGVDGRADGWHTRDFTHLDKVPLSRGFLSS